MKTKAQVSEALDILTEARAAPCTCTTADEKRKCNEGGLLMVAVEDALRWVLQANSRFDGLLSQLASRTTRLRGEDGVRGDGLQGKET